MMIMTKLLLASVVAVAPIHAFSTSVIHPIDVVLAVDRSGSMGKAIRTLQSTVPTIFAQLNSLAPNDPFRIAAVAFGQTWNDGKPAVVQTLTDSEQDFQHAMNKLENGGFMEPGYRTIWETSRNSIGGNALSSGDFPTSAGFCMILVSDELSSGDHGITREAAIRELHVNNAVFLPLVTELAGISYQQNPIATQTGGRIFSLANFTEKDANAVVEDLLTSCVKILQTKYPQTPSPTSMTAATAGGNSPSPTALEETPKPFTASPSVAPTTALPDECTPYDVACYECGALLECYVRDSRRPGAWRVKSFLESSEFCVKSNLHGGETVCGAQQCQATIVHREDILEDYCPVIGGFQCFASNFHYRPRLDTFATYRIGVCDDQGDPYMQILGCSGKCDQDKQVCGCEYGADTFCADCGRPTSQGSRSSSSPAMASLSPVVQPPIQPSPEPALLPSNSPSIHFECTHFSVGCYNCGQILECYVDDSPDKNNAWRVKAFLESSRFCHVAGNGGFESACGQQACQPTIVYRANQLLDSCPVVGEFQCRSNGHLLKDFVSYNLVICDNSGTKQVGVIGCSEQCGEDAEVCECDYGHDSFCPSCPPSLPAV